MLREQSKPCRKRGELFILSPGRTKRAPQFRNPLQESRGFHSECLPSAFQQFSLFDGAHRKPSAGARVNNGFAEKLAVRRVNQRMGSENFFQIRKRSSRSKQQPASRELHPLFSHSGFKLPHRAVSEASCLSLHPRDELASLTQQHLFCSVIRLPKFVGECFHEMDALPRQNNGRTFFQTHRNKCSPSRMHAKPNRSLFHTSLRITPAERLPQFHAQSLAPVPYQRGELESWFPSRSSRLS